MTIYYGVVIDIRGCPILKEVTPYGVLLTTEYRVHNSHCYKLWTVEPLAIGEQISFYHSIWFTLPRHLHNKVRVKSSVISWGVFSQIERPNCLGRVFVRWRRDLCVEYVRVKSSVISWGVFSQIGTAQLPGPSLCQGGDGTYAWNMEKSAV